MNNASPHKTNSVVNTPFIVAIVVMVIAAVALQAYTRLNHIHLAKQPVPPRRGLYLMPDTLGPYIKQADAHMPHAMIDEMGTKRYINWLVAGPPQSGLLFRVNIAYYTGLPDARPHIHTRCYSVGGVSPENPQHTTIQTSNIATPTPGDTPDSIPVTVADVRPANQNAQKIVTFYIANGRYVETAPQVLDIVTDPAASSAYWCKVEIMPIRIDASIHRGITDTQQALDAVGAYLNHLLPQLPACLPEATHPNNE
jgi:hypothetical protein